MPKFKGSDSAEAASIQPAANDGDSMATLASHKFDSHTDSMGNESSRFDNFATWWLLPGLLTFAMMSYGIWVIAPEMAVDELATWSMTYDRSFDHMLAAMNNVDAVHGAYYTFMRAWMRIFGDSSASMRLPSALAISAAASVLSIVVHKLFDDKQAALGAGVLFALVPATSRYGIEARSYALVILGVLVLTLLLLHALGNRKLWWMWPLYGLAVAFVGALHMVALSVLAGHLGIVVNHSRKNLDWRMLGHFLGAVTGVACMLTPWRSEVGDRPTRSCGGFESPTSGTFLRFRRKFSCHPCVQLWFLLSR